MTRKSVQEYLAAQRERYARGSRVERTRLLDEIAAVTRYHPPQGGAPARCSVEYGVRENHERARPLPGHRREGAVDLLGNPRLESLKPHPQSPSCNLRLSQLGCRLRLVCPTCMVNGRPPWAGPLYHVVGRPGDTVEYTHESHHRPVAGAG